MARFGTLKPTFTFQTQQWAYLKETDPAPLMTQTILIVDDDPVQRRLLETCISRAGQQTLTAMKDVYQCRQIMPAINAGIDRRLKMMAYTADAECRR